MCWALKYGIAASPAPSRPCLPLPGCGRWRLIEDKLRLSRYLDWTFVSCHGPLRVRAGGIGL